MFLCSRVASCLILLAAFWLSASAQSIQQPARQSGTAAVSGVVKLGDAPAVGIPMALVPNQNARQPQNQQDNILQATTDENGVYKFTGLVAGTYRVVPMTETFVITSNTANATGNAGRSGGFGGPGGQGGGKSVTVSDGQMVSQIDFTLARGGVITGRVSDNNDRPVIAERVTLMTVDATGQARPSGGGNRFGLETDDRGVYRAYGLPAGRYLVSAGNDGGNRIGPAAMRRTSYARTFHPATTEQAEAQVIELSEGTVAEGIDIRLDGPLKAYAVTGKVLDSQSGQPVPGVTISVAREARNGRFGPPQPGGGSSGASNEKGEFKITGLMPGKYAASATPFSFSGGTPTTGEFYSSEPASFEISGSDASGVEVKVVRGASIAGIVAIEGSNDPTVISKMSQLIVVANSRGAQQTQQRQGFGQGGGSTSGRTSLSAVSPEGLFRVSGLAPGTARLSINGGGFGGSGGGAFRLVRIERNGSPINGDIELISGEDVGGVRIVVGYGSAVIQGRVVVTGGTLPPNARLNVSARSLSNTTPTAGGGSNARVEADGQFRIENLLPGTYEVRLTGNLGGGFGGRGQGGAPGRGGQAGQGTGQQQQPTRLPDVRQTVTVANGAPTNVTLTLNLAQ